MTRTCLECVTEIEGSVLKKFCQRKCQNTYNTRVRREKSNVSSFLDECLRCGVSIERPRRKFCSRKCSSTYNHQKDGWSVQTRCRGRSPEAFIRSLMNHYNRKETLSVEYVVDLFYKQEGLCAISGMEMTHISGQGKVGTNISLDRIDPKLGYVEGNVQLTTRDVNIFKSMMTLEETYGLCEKILEHRDNKTSNNKMSNLKAQSKSKNRSFARTKTAKRKKK